MGAHAHARRALAPVAAGGAVGLAGLAFVGAGLWARRDVRRGLARERITSADGRAAPVVDARGARALAEFIRSNTLEAAGGRTYSETDAYVDAAGNPTAESALAARHELTGQPVENPDHDLWVQSTTLQTALMQAYMAFRLSELTIAIGASLAALGLGLAAVTRSRA